MKEKLSLYSLILTTKLIAQSFYTLCMSEPTLWTLIFKCELCLTTI